MTIRQEFWLSLRVTAGVAVLWVLVLFAWELIAQARGLDRLMP